MEKKRVKTGGRTKGTPNEKTAMMREKVSKLISLTLEEMDKNNDISLLKPHERVDFLCKLIAYVCPKPVETTPEEDRTRRSVNDILASLAGKRKPEDDND